MKNLIGIETSKANALNEKLNILLANYQMFYMNVRGFHWNIKGRKFFELHLKFEELYDDLVIKVDEIAERILTLEGMPDHSFTAYLEKTNIQEMKNVTDGDVAVKAILESFKTLLPLQREILSLAGEADDEGTSALMSDYIREQEKLVWMYNAFMD
jgi:starvation-inducible DNA-binding protein